MCAMPRFTAVSVALTLLSASPADAQQPQGRRGFWAGAGLGVGSLGFACDGCASADRRSAASGYVKLGGTLNAHLRLGGETDLWVKSQGGTTVVAGNTSAAAYYYPAPARGLFLRGGLGIAYYQEKEATNAAIGLGFVVGVGCDLRVGPNLSLTPVANFNWGRPGDVERGLVTLPGVTENVVQVALGLTFH